MLNDPQSAQYALLALCAEDMYSALPANNKGNLTPPVDPRVAANWTVVGFISGRDALLDTQSVGIGVPLFYGFLAYRNTINTQYVAVIRGTDNGIEWIEDVEFLPVDAGAPIPGKVENGFYSIYLSMSYTPLAQGGTGQPVAAGIAAAVGQNQLTIVGHSLGSALATYLTLDLATKTPLKANLSACMIASPHAGNAVYGQYFAQNVATYKVYNYSHDVVPKVPLFFDYQPLPGAMEFAPQDAQATIRHTLGCNHHAACYAAMLDYNVADWSQFPGIGVKDADGNAPCLVGKAQGG